MNFRYGETRQLKYLMAFPESFDPKQKYPVILFLHGAGTRGSNLEKLKNNPFFNEIAKYKDFPFVILAPQCSENTWFDMFERLKDFSADIVRFDFADPKRIYLMGASMGGYAVWQLAMSMPDYFAAAVPICGGGMYWNAGRLVNLPIWAFHGGRDATVFPEESKKMTDAVNAAGGSAKLTIYPENSHDSWSDTYSNPEVFKWLLTNKNQRVKITDDNYIDPEKFG